MTYSSSRAYSATTTTYEHGFAALLKPTGFFNLPACYHATSALQDSLPGRCDMPQCFERPATPWLCCQWCLIQGPLFMRPWHAKLWRLKFDCMRLSICILECPSMMLTWNQIEYLMTGKKPFPAFLKQCSLEKRLPMISPWGVDFICAGCTQILKFYWLVLARLVIPRGHAPSGCFNGYHKLCYDMQTSIIALEWLPHVWENVTALVAKGFCLSEKHLVW